MIAVWLSPLYLLLNAFLAFQAARLLTQVHPVLGSLWFSAAFFLCYALAALSPLPAAFGRGRVKVVSKKISGWWLGALMYLASLMLLAWVLNHFIHTSLVWILAPAGTLLLSLYGTANAGCLRRTVCHVTIHKACALPSLTIVLAADLHMGGAVGLRHMKKVCGAIKEAAPDLVVFAGDMFDNDFETIDAPEEIRAALKSISPRYGTYACWGNHDISEVILAGFTFDRQDAKAAASPEMIRFLEEADIRVLEDETVLVDNQFYLCGRLDASCEEKSGRKRLTPSQLTASLDHSRPIFVMDHQPSQLAELAKAGVDLDLSGHTHAGQIFPLNLTSRLLWKNPQGLKVIGHMVSAVTSGAGIWGPSLRIGTHSEIMEIHVHFQPPDKLPSAPQS